MTAVSTVTDTQLVNASNNIVQISHNFINCETYYLPLKH